MNPGVPGLSPDGNFSCFKKKKAHLKWLMGTTNKVNILLLHVCFYT